jgi:hypothetical protein
VGANVAYEKDDEILYVGPFETKYLQGESLDDIQFVTLSNGPQPGRQNS